MKKLPTIRRNDKPTTRTGSTPYTRRWRKVRYAELRKHMYQCAVDNQNPCEDCAAEGKGYEVHRRPLEWHHPVMIAEDPSRQYDPTNRIWLCKMHHTIRTNRGE